MTDPETDGDAEPQPATAKAFVDALRGLPIVEDDFYLGSQVLHLGVASSVIEQFEGDLMREYWRDDHVSPDRFMVVASLSQLWVFGVYEVLRTWRQRVQSVLKFVANLPTEPTARHSSIAAKKADVEGRYSHPDLVHDIHADVYERAARDAAYVTRLRGCLHRSERSFRRIEALRVNIAKHEVPKVNGDSYIVGPGSSRIDTVTGTLQWQVDLGNREVDMVSRASVLQAGVDIGTNRRILLLPDSLQALVRKLPRVGYGVHKVVLELSNGHEVIGFVAWDQEIINAIGRPLQSLDTADIVGVRGATAG